jgi:iron(III) transport system ATP-binding protein
MSSIRLDSVNKSIGGIPILEDITMEIADGSVTALLGPSGSGKTSILRLIAGLDRSDRGEITIGSQVVDAGRTHLPAQGRRVGYVPQEGAVFPHMTVLENVAFGAASGQRRRGQARVSGPLITDLIEMTGLSGLEQRRAHQLSGGQRQRVALARALATSPRVVLLDEPFSSLDAELAESVRSEMMRMLRSIRATVVLVTHNQAEALAVADQIVLINRGRVLATGSPWDLYERPTTPVVAQALGPANIVSGQFCPEGLRCPVGTLPVDNPGPDGSAVQALLRPERFVVSIDHLSPNAKVLEVEYLGHETRVRLEVQGTEILARCPGGLMVEAGSPVGLGYRGTAWPFPG